MIWLIGAPHNFPGIKVHSQIVTIAVCWSVPDASECGENFRISINALQPPSILPQSSGVRFGTGKLLPELSARTFWTNAIVSAKNQDGEEY
jgi:hypothetical protein